MQGKFRLVLGKGLNNVQRKSTSGKKLALKSLTIRATPGAVEPRSSLLTSSVGSVNHISLHSQGFPSPQEGRYIKSDSGEHRSEKANLCPQRSDQEVQTMQPPWTLEQGHHRSQPWGFPDPSSPARKRREKCRHSSLLLSRSQNTVERTKDSKAHVSISKGTMDGTIPSLSQEKEICE